MHYECKKQNDKLTFDLQKKVSQNYFHSKTNLILINLWKV